jgi:signal transduction histidine kinase
MERAPAATVSREALTGGGSSLTAAEPPYLAGPPLFWRLLAANLFVVLGGALIGTAFTRQFVLSGSFTPLTHAAMVLVAIALSAGLTAFILHLAFRPLRALRQAIELAPDAALGSREDLLVRDRFGDPDIMAVAAAVRGLWERLDQQVMLLQDSNRRLVEHQQELAEKTRQMERLASMALAAQEEERRRIARELHDDTMQSIAALIMGLERGMQAMPGDVPHLHQAHQTVARLRDLALRTLEDLRHLALDLRPSVLDDHGLPAALRWLAQTVEERGGPPVSVQIDPDVDPLGGRLTTPRLEPMVETALFRIAQEALTNVAKHARATAVWLRLSSTGVTVQIEVEDDGVGLTAEAPTPNHMGLFNMRERAALLGGWCTVGSSPNGSGTLVRAALPTVSAVSGEVELPAA